MLRSIVVASIVLVSIAGTNAPTVVMPKHATTRDSVRLLLRTAQSGFASALRSVVTDSTRFHSLWTELVWGAQPAARMPKIDFDREMVIVAAMGSMPGTAFGVAIDSAVVASGGLHVYVSMSRAGYRCPQGMMATRPAALIAVRKFAGVVLFHDRLTTADCKAG